MEVKIESSWKKVLSQEFEKPYFSELMNFLEWEKSQWKTIYPQSENIFSAFRYTPFHQVRVVILGQDPYHGPGQAHGLSFSVPDGIKFPPSLRNIFKEISTSCNISVPESGNLEHWAKQGIFLLNSVLTVEGGQPASHAGRGWEDFTDAVISQISEKKEGVIFLLWWAYAQKKVDLINSKTHTILMTTHPSPFSAYRGFLGSGQFVQVNEILEKKGQKKISW